MCNQFCNLREALHVLVVLADIFKEIWPYFFQELLILKLLGSFWIFEVLNDQMQVGSIHEHLYYDGESMVQSVVTFRVTAIIKNKSFK